MIPQDRHVPERLLLARHGQTVWNVEHRLQGQLDSPLTDEGVAQSLAIADLLADRGVLTVCSSPLGRAMQTAIIIAERVGAQLIEVPELAELDHGELAGMTWDEIEAAYPTAREERAANRYGWAFPGGESYAQARARARKALSACGWASEGAPLLVDRTDAAGGTAGPRRIERPRTPASARRGLRDRRRLGADALTPSA